MRGRGGGPLIRISRTAQSKYLRRCMREADLAVRPQSLVVEDSSSLADSEFAARTNQLVIVMSYVSVHRFIAHPMHGKVSRYQNAIAVRSDDAHVGYHPPRPRARILRPRRLA